MRLQIDPVEGEPVLLYPEGLVKLNETAHAVLTRCDGTTTVANIIAALGAEYDVCADDLRADVLACLAQLRDQQLVVFGA